MRNSSNLPVQIPGLGLLDSREARADLPRSLQVRPQVRGLVRAVIRMRPRSPDCREARAVQQPNHPLAQPRRRSSVDANISHVVRAPRQMACGPLAGLIISDIANTFSG